MTTRLEARLQRLEGGSGEGSSDSMRLLVSLLGRHDALFWPWRTNGSYRAEIRRLQVEYLAGTSGLRASASGETSWKSAHLARSELVARGQCTALTSGGQVTALRLSSQGISDARALVGDRLETLGGSQVARIVYVLLRKHADWMLEGELFGAEVVSSGNPSDWEHKIEHVLPLLACGLIESTSDSWHRVYLRAVDGVALPEEPASELAAEPWGDALYLEAFAQERQALERLESTDGGLFIPRRCT